jgi:glycosyltransferase involved in cell wall biosynthesis
MKEPKSEKSPLVSVIVPSYNRRVWIEECLDSVLAQTYSNVEAIVVDDRSTDDTVDWLRSQKKYENVVVHVQDENGGASLARNKGIEIAQGELIAFIDSDDALMPEHLEKAVASFNEHPDLGLFCCDSTMIDADGNILAAGKTWHQTLAAIKNYDVRTDFRSLDDVFAFSNCFPGFTLRRQVFEELGAFDQDIFPADDYDLALRVAGSRYKVLYLHEPLCRRREHDGQCSGIHNSVKTCEKMLEALERAIERDPEKLLNRDRVRQRLAEVQFEIGVSQMKEGRSAGGAARVAGSILKDPKQLAKAAKIGGRKIRSLISSS